MPGRDATSVSSATSMLTLYTVQFIVDSGQWTGDRGQGTVNSGQWTVDSVKCVVHSVQCTVYSIHSRVLLECTMYSYSVQYKL